MKRERFRYRAILYAFLAVFVHTNYAYAQDDPDSNTVQEEKVRHWTVAGYIKDLQFIQFTDFNKEWTLDNLVHNRLDIHGFADSSWKFHLGLRNRFLYGQSAALYKQNQSLLGDINGLFDLSKTIASGNSYLLHSAIDRASVDFTRGKWQVTVGRQRINWGLNLVWNPNDIFNAYSYFDFDYEERPGTDAIRLQYYAGSTSSLELAYKPGRRAGQTSLAGLYRFNRNSYDFQFLGGIVNHDLVLGGGWSGVLGTAGFNGELSTFIPVQDPAGSRVVWSGSLGVNYTFPNSLYLHGAYLLNSAGTTKADSMLQGTLLNNVTAKFLSPSRHSLFVEGAYQFTPLIRGDLAGIVNPSDGSFFVGPFFSFSLTGTMELLTGGQLFFGREQTLYGGYGRILFIRFKWSF